MRLIDGNEARRRIVAFATGLHSEVLPVDSVMILLAQEAVVDVVTVVRCKDCAHGVWDDSSGLWQCVKDADYDEKAKIYCGFSAWHDAEFYCADGEVPECAPIR